MADLSAWIALQLPVEQEDAGTMQPDERSAHAGLAVEGGDKWIATKWIHSMPYPNGPKETVAKGK